MMAGAGDEAGVVVEVVADVEDSEVEDGEGEGVEAMVAALGFRKVSRTPPGSVVKFKYSWRVSHPELRSRSWFSISQLWGRSRWTDSAGSPGFTFTRIKRAASPLERRPSHTWTVRHS